jgi:hypothetical protein
VDAFGGVAKRDETLAVKAGAERRTAGVETKEL